MVRGLANKDAAKIIAARADTPFASIEDLWRRANVPVAALERLADADAFRPSLKLARREAIWAIRALRDEPLPLFAASVPEAAEPHLSLRPLLAGQEVVEDYGAISLTLRAHPLAFLRSELNSKRARPCVEILHAKDGARLTIAGLVLLRQMPGSASGVLFMTIEDETANANLIVWPKIFEKQRRLILSSPMIATKGRVQREGEVIHFVAQEFFDLSNLLHSVGSRELVQKPGDIGDPWSDSSR
jgi:error-prone DNA polymerase